MLDDARRANLANWNDRVDIHLDSDDYDIEALVRDPDRLSGVVRYDAPRLGDVSGARLLHLQCHLGTDTLSWARLGADVTGTDFSSVALAAARDLAQRAGVEARFVEAELYETPEALGGETFDVVYVSVGSLCWLPDIQGWAEAAAALLAPGGRLYVRDVHPIIGALDDTRDELVLAHPYFATGEPHVWDDAQSYTGGGGLIANSRHYEWTHSLGEIVTAVLSAGLTLTGLDEHRELEWPFYEWMEPVGGGRYALPEPLRDRAPLMFTLQATKAAGAA